MKSVVSHPVLGEIILSCTRRATRITLSVRPSGEVRLSFPPYISQRRAMAFLESKREWLISARQRYLDRNTIPSLTEAQVEVLRAEAKRLLPERVAYIAEKYGLKYGRVTIRNTRSKWGSCTAQGNLSLSLHLMTLPEHLRDYVILHELCHTVHHNHSAEFHALVDRLVEGRERELACELRSYAIR